MFIENPPSVDLVFGKHLKNKIYLFLRVAKDIFKITKKIWFTLLQHVF